MTDTTTARPDYLTAPIVAPGDQTIDAPLTGLEQVIEAAMADPQHWAAFEALLPRVDLYISPEGETAKGLKAGEVGMKTLRPDEQLDLRGVRLDDGRTAAAAFTDPRRLTAVWGADRPIIAINALSVLRLWRDRPVMLNPGAPRVLLFQIDDVANLIAAGEAHAAEQKAAATSRPVGPSSGQVRLASPDRIPETLLARLTQAFGPVGGTGVTAAWLARATWSESGQQGWFLDIRTSRPSDEIRAMVQRAVTGLAFGEETLDVSVAPSGGVDGTGIRFV
jgi:hypothetical protein